MGGKAGGGGSFSCGEEGGRGAGEGVGCFCVCLEERIIYWSPVSGLLRVCFLHLAYVIFLLFFYGSIPTIAAFEMVSRRYLRA